MGTDIIRYPYKVVHEELGIINCRFYDLRGSFATKSLRNGVEIKDVADILGHSNIETTENYYISSSKDIDDENAGKYRTENVTIKGATHIPPDYLIVPELMEKLIINYNTWKEYHPIIRAALLHGELVKINPFVDGNGRTSRLLMNLDLMNNGYVPLIIKKENRLNYYEALDKAHTTNDYTCFVKLVVKAEIDILNKYLELL